MMVSGHRLSLLERVERLVGCSAARYLFLTHIRADPILIKDVFRVWTLHLNLELLLRRFLKRTVLGVVIEQRVVQLARG